MQIHTISAELLAEGREAFTGGVTQCLGGTHGERSTGVRVVPGAIVALMELGIVTKRDIVPMVARVSRCRQSTVEIILETLGGANVPDSPWASTGEGSFRLRAETELRPFTILAN